MRAGAYHDADISAVLEVIGSHGAKVSVGMAAAQQQELAGQLCCAIHCMSYQVDALHAPPHLCSLKLPHLLFAQLL